MVTLERRSDLPSEYPDLIDFRAQLPVNPNYTWYDLTGGPRSVDDLSTIVLHHDAWPKAYTASYDDLTLARKIGEDHIASKANESKGDAGFPYHVWIRNGRWYWCNDLEAFTYGVSSNNGYTVHICVSGDYFNYDTLTDADRNALYAAILSVRSVLPNCTVIKGHRDLNPTDCPGYDLKRVHDDIAKLETQLKADADPKKTKQKCYIAANQHFYLYSEYAKDPDKNKWIEPWLLDLEQFMQEKGMFFDK